MTRDLTVTRRVGTAPGQWSHGPVVPAPAPMLDISTVARG